MDPLVLTCRRCATPLTAALTRATPTLDPAAVEYVDSRTRHRDLVAPGGYAVADPAMAGALGNWEVREGDLLTNVDDERDTRPTGRRVGCCGVDGQDGLNLACVKGHRVGTEIRDCWTPHVVVFDAGAVTAEQPGRRTRPLESDR